LENEPRKASEVLLELEKTVNILLSIIRAQDLNIKILSNKLNTVIENMNKQPPAAKFTAEAVHTARPLPPVSPFQQTFELDPERQIPVSSEARLPMEMEPQGFRRTSRPETFAGDDSYLPQSTPQTDKIQMPKAPPGRGGPTPPPGRTAEVVVPPAATKQKATAPTAKQQHQQPRTQNIVQNAIPVMQRVVDSSGKSLFLADVEIIDLATMQSIYSTRTNGMGKWMASLGIGTYRVLIRKMEKLTGSKKETPQDIQVDGTQSPLELQTIIIK
jgi:putative ATP-grasp target RiPP